PRVHTSCLLSTIAGGCERTWTTPSGIGCVTSIERLSTLPLLAMVDVYVISASRVAVGGPVTLRLMAGANHSTAVSPRASDTPAPAGKIQLASTHLQLTKTRLFSQLKIPGA